MTTSIMRIHQVVLQLSVLGNINVRPTRMAEYDNYRIVVGAHAFQPIPVTESRLNRVPPNRKLTLRCEENNAALDAVLRSQLNQGGPVELIFFPTGVEASTEYARMEVVASSKFVFLFGALLGGSYNPPATCLIMVDEDRLGEVIAYRPECLTEGTPMIAVRSDSGIEFLIWQSLRQGIQPTLELPD